MTDLKLKIGFTSVIAGLLLCALGLTTLAEAYWPAVAVVSLVIIIGPAMWIMWFSKSEGP